MAALDEAEKRGEAGRVVVVPKQCGVVVSRGQTG
jgi:hypothetical protein